MQTTPALPARTGTLLAITSIMFLVSWFLPVAGEGGAGTGHAAYKATYTILFSLGDRAEWMSGSMEDIIMLILMGISPHTNYIMIIAILWLAFGRNSLGNKPRVFLQVLLFISFLINLIWLYTFHESISAIGIGYYIWAISFLLMTITYSTFKSYRRPPRNEPFPVDSGNPVV